jgi:hypothetical protein
LPSGLQLIVGRLKSLQTLLLIAQSRIALQAVRKALEAVRDSSAQHLLGAVDDSCEGRGAITQPTALIIGRAGFYSLNAAAWQTSPNEKGRPAFTVNAPIVLCGSKKGES